MTAQEPTAKRIVQLREMFRRADAGNYGFMANRAYAELERIEEILTDHCAPDGSRCMCEACVEYFDLLRCPDND